MAIRRIAAIGLLALTAGIASAQDTFYITDILQLGLHRAEDTSDSPFRNLVSGTEVTVIERIPNFARVRTADGDEGWVDQAQMELTNRKRPALSAQASTMFRVPSRIGP